MLLVSLIYSGETIYWPSTESPPLLTLVSSLYALLIERLLIRRQGVSFVVPDALLETGRSTLSYAGFLPCTQGPKCPYPNSAPCLETATHLHINDELVISLHRKSDVLWDFPDLEIGANSTDIMSAADTRLPPERLGRGQGRFPPSLSGVRIPSAVRYCEAMIRLLCLDSESPREPYWMAILTYLLEYVDETDIFQKNWLREGYRQFYEAMKQGDPEMYLHLRTLRDVFIKSSVWGFKRGLLVNQSLWSHNPLRSCPGSTIASPSNTGEIVSSLIW